MKITTLIENTTCSPELTAEHGLSLYVEAAGHRFVFDTGASGAFADNAARLGIDLAAAEFAILSHGHYDHGGGLGRFLELNPSAGVYASRHCFDECRNASGKYIGLPPALRCCGRLVLTGDEYAIAPGLTLCSCNHRPERADPWGLTRREGERLIPDDFRHEQYLLIEEEGKRILLSGCSHKGIVQLVRWFRPDVLVGGFHYMKADPVADAERLRASALRLMELPTCYYTGHCTGDVAYGVMLPLMGERLQGISTGQVIEL